MNKKQNRLFRFGKKFMSLVLMSAVSATMFTGLGSIAFSTEVNAATKIDYGLADNIQDGTILHCFDWTYNDIKEELPNIAEAGFTSIQTSPAQVGAGEGVWWWLYQPLGFYVGTNALGTEEELQALIEEAHSYGIKVVVDIVANHLAGDHTNIQDDLKDSKYWHTYGKVTNWKDRTQVTQGEIGMPDLNSEDPHVQQVVANYVLELKELGVDGLRWDAAKHIALPSEGCDFWPAVIDDDMFNYGEILGNPGGDDSDYLMVEYSNYMTVTDGGYGSTLRNYLKSGYVPSAYGNWVTRGVSPDKLIYWGETHDTWSNDTEGEYSHDCSQNVIDRAYALAASRNEVTALYFSRPDKKVKAEIFAGVKGSTHFTEPEVAAVNHFHNAMIGQTDYYTTTDNVAAVCREQGAVIVMGDGSDSDVSVTNGGSTTAPGKYYDEITGNEWIVTSSTISGHVGDTGIAVIYSEEMTTGTISASQSTNTSFTDTLTVTLKSSKITNATYSTSEGASGSFSSGDTITLGASTTAGSKVTLTLTGTNSKNETVTKKYVYYKKDPNAAVTLYFDNSGYNWASVYAYVYAPSGTKTLENAEWPGVQMTYNSSTKLYELTLDSTLEYGKAIFVEKKGSSNRYPGANESGLSINGLSMLFSSGNSWTVYDPESGAGSVSASPDTGAGFTGTLKVTLNCSRVSSASYTTSEGASGKFTDGTTITVGSSTAAGSSVTVTLTGMGNDGEEVSETYVYKKRTSDQVTLYFDNSSYGWSKVNAYIYNSAGNNATWPGEAMTYNSATGLYEYDVDSEFVNGQVIFTEGKSSSNRYPLLSGDPGMDIGGKSMLFSAGYSWTEYTSEQEEFTNTSSLSAEKIALGDKLTINFASTGGEGTVRYAVYYKLSTDSAWTLKQNYKTNASLDFKPGSAAPYSFKIKAKDESGNVNTVTLTATVTANANTELTNKSKVSAATIAYGKSFKITCASSGSDSVNYAVYYKKAANSTWTLKQNYSTNTSLSLKPNSAAPYYVKVKAKDSSGNVATATFTVKVTASADTSFTNTSSVSAEKITKGESITVKASSTGGTGTVTYAVLYKKNSSSNWIAVQGYKDNTSVTITPAVATPYTICVKAKDADGNIARAYYSVTVSK